MTKVQKLILAIMLSALAWTITTLLIIEIPFWKFVLLEFLIAIFQIIAKLAMNKAEGKPLLSERKNDFVQPVNQDEK